MTNDDLEFCACCGRELHECPCDVELRTDPGDPSVGMQPFEAWYCFTHSRVAN